MKNNFKYKREETIRDKMTDYVPEMTLWEIKQTKDYKQIPYGYNKSTLSKNELIDLINSLYLDEEEDVENTIRITSSDPENMKELELLTVSEVKRRFKENPLEPIPIYIDQTCTSENKRWVADDEDPYEYFLPTGHLIKVDSRNSGKKWVPISKRSSVPYEKGEITLNWLYSSEKGPYNQEHIGKGQPIFYHLTGLRKYQKDGEYSSYHYQICSGPLNVLSHDCLDEVNCWMETGRKMKKNKDMNIGLCGN